MPPLSSAGACLCVAFALPSGFRSHFLSTAAVRVALEPFFLFFASGRLLATWNPPPFAFLSVPAQRSPATTQRTRPYATRHTQRVKLVQLALPRHDPCGNERHAVGRRVVQGEGGDARESGGDEAAAAAAAASSGGCATIACVALYACDV